MKKMLRAAANCITCLLVLFSYELVQAQDTIRKQAFYNTRILSNKPEMVNNLHLALSPVYIDANNLNIAFGYGVEATYLYKHRLNLNARYQRAYLDRTEESAEADDVPGLAATGSMPSRNLDLGATYYFFKDTSLTSEPIFIDRHRIGGEPMDFNIDVAAKRLRMWGLRGGFIAFKSFIRDNENVIDFKGYLADDPASQLIDFKGAYSTMMETNTYYAGISRLDITNLLLEVEGYGQRSRKRRAEMYADIMYAPQIVYYNMSAHGTANSIGFQEYNVNTHTARSRFGARFGYTRW
ncbi:MAG: hypothetical protein ACXWXW_08610, partial [Bacteroidia bacterium]